jgi:hypothetical protein
LVASKKDVPTLRVSQSGLQRCLFDLSVSKDADGWGRFEMSDVSVVCLCDSKSLSTMEVGGRYILLCLIWRSTSVMPSFLWLGIFLFSLRRMYLVCAPLCHSWCLAAMAAPIARVQYLCVFRCVAVSLVKLNSRRNRQLSGISSGLMSDSAAISCKRSSNCLFLK